MRKASIASGLYLTSANFSQATEAAAADAIPPAYVTLHRRVSSSAVRRVPNDQNHKQPQLHHFSSRSPRGGKEISAPGSASSPANWSTAFAPRHRSNRLSENSSSLRALFSSSSSTTRHENSKRKTSHTLLGAATDLRTRARLCASAGDLSRVRSSSPKFSFKSTKFLDTFPRVASSTQHSVSVSSSCWRSRRSKNSNRSSSSCEVGEEAEDAYSYRVKITSQDLNKNWAEITKSGLSMAPPQTTNSGKSGKLKNTPKSSASHDHRPTSFMSRFFATNSDKQRRRQEQKSSSAHSAHSKPSTTADIPIDARTSDGVAVPERRLSTPIPSNGPPLLYNTDDDHPSAATDTEEGKSGDRVTETQPHPAYSTSSLGRYASKVKQQLFVYKEASGDQSAAEGAEEDWTEAGSVKELSSANLGSAPTQLSTSLKTLSQLSATKREVKLGAGSENDLCSATPSGVAVEGVVEANSDYRRSLINSLGAAVARRSSNTAGADGGFPTSTVNARRENEETNKKPKSLISSSLAFPRFGQRSRQQNATGGNGSANNVDRSSSISGSAGSISKSAAAGSGGLAGKISRGLFQEFASSSERLMSWKAKLKKTKLDGAPATGQGGEEAEEEEEDDRPPSDSSDVFERQNLADLTAKSDPLPRAPKYIYKTNSMDSNYDMAMGAYDNGDSNLDIAAGQQQLMWVMGQKRPQQILAAGGRPDGFYVGLTLVNAGALESEGRAVGGAPDGTGVYFSNTGDSSAATAGATSGSGAGVRQGTSHKSNRVAPHFSHHPTSSVLEEGAKSSTAAALLVDDSGKHYEEIDLVAVKWKEGPNALLTNMDCHHNVGHHNPYHYQHHNQAAGVYNVQQQQAAPHSGFNQKSMAGDDGGHQLPPLPPNTSNLQNSYASDDLSLPPPTRITPYSGVPQAKDGEIVRPIAFRPIAPGSGTRSHSISNPSSVNNEIVVVTPMKQAQITSYRHSSPSTDLTYSNYDNTIAAADPSHSHKGAHNASAFTPPSVRRLAHHLTLVSSTASADTQSMHEEEDRLSNCSRARDAHSMTPARSVHPPQQQYWHQQALAQNENTSGGWQGRAAQPPPPQQRPQPISYQDYLRQNQQQQLEQQQRFSQVAHVKPNVSGGGNANANQAQNEYDMIPDIRPQPPNRSNFPITPTGNRSFDFNVAPQQKKAPPPQHPVPPVRTTASLASGHHHPQQQQQQQQQQLLHQQQSGATEGGVSGGSQNYGSLGSRNSSGIHVTPSPSDSGVAELELALREKENELVHLRQTMEHNEQAIVRVYQEKEQRWQEKLREWAKRLEHAVTTEQRFLLEIDQLQTERADLHNRIQTLLAEKQGLQRKCKELETDLFAAKARLDERRQTNWIVCKQCGCVLTFESRANAASTTSPDDEMVSSRDSHQLPDPPYPPSSQSPKIRYRRTPPAAPSIDNESSLGADESDSILRSEVECLKTEVSGLRQSLHDQVSAFNTERRRWEVEKQRVLQYQKLLEDAYQVNCMQQQQEQKLSAHSTPTGTLKGANKEFNVHPYAYGSLQHAPSPYHTASGANLNLVHSEPELEV